MSLSNKRGLSPVIATVLLISLALILALIIFLWARNFVAEKTQKLGQPIETFCEKVSFDADAIISGSDAYLSLVNRANVPIYGVQVTKKGLGQSEYIDIPDKTATIAVGQTANIDLDPTNLEVGNVLIVSPILVGTQKDSEKAYICDDSYGKEVTVVLE